MSEDILDIFNADSADEMSDIRYDATMSNLLTKMGTGSDRTTQTVPHGIGYWSQGTLEDLAEHLILNRVASAKVDASTQKGWELTLGSDGDDDILEDFNDLHDDLEIEEAFNEAQFQANVYGGAVIIIIVDDKKPAYEPIDTKNLKKVVKLEVLDRYKVEPVLALTDVNPLRPDKYRLILPEYVRKSLKTVVDDNPQYIIDKSRIIRFDADGIRATPDMLRKNQGWTKSLLAALWEDYLEWKTSLKATGAMVQDASIFIYKLKNLSAMMKSKDSLLLEGRIKLFRSMLSVIGGAIIDAEKESMEFISRNFAGVPEVANQQRDNFIGVADIPHTKLFGESPSGLGASGESEQKDWASTIADFQTSKWRKKLRGLFKLIFLSKEGPTNGELIKGWSIKFHNLMVESEAEKISNMATMASTDQTYISAGVLLVEEVRKSRFGKSGFSIETTLDDKLFKKQQDEAKQQAQDPYGGYGGFPEEQAPPEELPPDGEVPPEEVQQDSYDYRADAVDISSLKQKDGKVFYLGKWWQPDNPMPSDRPGKKRMVLAKEGDQVALVHYGAEGYKHNYSPEAKKSFLARMQGVRTKDGKLAYKDKFSPAYWAIKDLWNPNEPADGSAKYDAMSVGGFADELNASSYSRPKKVLNWNNIGIGLTHEAGDVRFPMSEPMKCGYGHIRGSYGDAPDKKALDVYVGDDLKSANGYKVRQLDPKTGFYDEDKYFIGFKTPEDVRNNFIYHAGASRFGGIEPIKPDELSAYRQDNCGCSVPEIDAGTKVLSGDRRITVTNDKNIADAITSIYPEKISSLDKWDVAGNGNIFGEFSSDYGTYKFGIKKGSKQDVLTYKWNRESKTDSVTPKKKDEDVVDLIVEKYRGAIAQGINSWINVITKKIQGEDNLEDINVADYYDSLTSKQFMNQLEQSILISKLAGMLDTENDEVDFKADGIADWFKQTFAEQLAYFRSKLIFTTKSWKDFRAEQYDVAFTISGLTRGDLLEDAKWLVDKAIANGDDVETFKRQFKRLIGRKGWQADDNRIYTILDTNSRRSYAAGRWQQAMTPEIMQRRPYLVWVHRDSVVPRPNHLALNNKAIRSDHPFWKVAFPSCAFSCRCSAFTANERMLNRMGATILDNPPDPMTIAETGFQRAAGSMPEVERQEIIDSTLARLSPEIREKVEANVSDQSREDAWWNPMQHIRNSRGQFAKKAVGRTIKVGTKIVASNLPTAAKKAAKVGANVTAKKIAGENANLKEEATNLIAEISGEGLGNVLGGITGGKPGELIGGLLGSIASDGIKHVTKISKKEYAEAALDQAFQAASAIAKTKMLAENIANEIKRTSKEHQETVKDTVSGWIAENIAGTLNNDIVTTLASEFINPTDIKEIIRKIRERRANNPGASNQNNSNNSP